MNFLLIYDFCFLLLHPSSGFHTFLAEQANKLTDFKTFQYLIGREKKQEHFF